MSCGHENKTYANNKGAYQTAHHLSRLISIFAAHYLDINAFYFQTWSSIMLVASKAGCY